MSRSRVLGFFAAAAAAAAAVAAATGLAAAPARAELPLGPRSLDERQTVRTLAPGITWTRVARGTRGGGGPWRVNVLTVARGVRVAAALSDGQLPGRQPVSAIARGARAVAAVNGGFFGSSGVFDGDPIGALGVGGELLSEPVGGRTALVLPPPGGAARVLRLRFAGSARVGAGTRLLDGVNRARGLIASCGGRGGDLPGERPGAAVVCTDASELVLLTPSFGSRTGTLGGVEAIVRGGTVSRVRESGNSRIPSDGYVLSGSGDAARLLLREARPGVLPELDLGLRAGSRRLAADWDSIVAGGPRLVRAGRVRIGTAAEGFRSDFAARHPRTLAGMRADGSLLLVTVDGRRPGYSVGVTLGEAARTMRALGARNALALDGGGSTTMTVGGRVVNRPSDGVERAVSDAIVVGP